MRIRSWTIIIVCLLLGFAVTVDGQTKKKTPKVKNAPPSTTPTPDASPDPTPVPVKRNERPVDSQGVARDQTGYVPTYFYEFSRPGFTVSHILIEHDVNGKGKISFLTSGSDNMVTDPLQLTPPMLTAINGALERLNFLSSTENYQYEKDFSNLGNISFRYKRDGLERTVKYNWTLNKDAKFLMDEYRRISNEAVWKFNITVARENQPLESPAMLEDLDGLLKRDEIADPPHLKSLLTELSIDERLPLIARNHAAKLVKDIDKVKK